MKLKICGMHHNITEVAALKPDYLGFIFWEPSSRYFSGKIPNIPKSIKKTGVFVNASITSVLHHIIDHQLDGVQLHGQESAAYVTLLKQALFEVKVKETLVAENPFEIIKVFSLLDSFDFSLLKPFEDVCDYFLFDTKGKLPGGNGHTFDWSILTDYPSEKQYFLSGGIGLKSVAKIRNFLKDPASKYCYAIDVNSGFEDEPGLKNIKALRDFKEELSI